MTSQMKCLAVFGSILSAGLPVGAVPTAGGAPAAGPFGGGMMGIIPWILIFVVFYFLLIRPQKKQAQEHKAMIDALKKGDRILTQGGLYGTVSAVKGKVLEVKLSDDVKVLMNKSAVSQLVSMDPAQEEQESSPVKS